MCPPAEIKKDPPDISDGSEITDIISRRQVIPQRFRKRGAKWAVNLQLSEYGIYFSYLSNI